MADLDGVLRDACASYVRSIRGHGHKEIKPGDLGIIVVLALPGREPQWASNIKREDVRQVFDKLGENTALECLVVDRK